MDTYKYNPLLSKGLELQQEALGSTLDTVTTAGAITDNNITVGEITTSKVTVSSGLNTQILHADGSLEENRFDAVDEPIAVALALSSIPTIDRWVGRKVLCNGVEYVFSSLEDSGLVKSFQLSENEGSSLVVSKVKANMEISTISITSNKLTIKFKAETLGLSYLLIKSQSLGILTPTSFAVIIPSFPSYRDLSIYEIDLLVPFAPTSTTYPNIDLAETSVNDIEIINYGLYINSSLISYQRTSNIATITLNSDGVYDTFTANIHCPDFGLTAINDVFYLFTRLTPTSYKVQTTAGVDITGADIPTTSITTDNCIIYYSSDVTESAHGIVDVLEDVKRSRFSGSTANGYQINNTIDYTNGTRSVNLFNSRMGWKGDPTGEFLPTHSTTVLNHFTALPKFVNNRPRVPISTTYNQYYGEGRFGGVSSADSAFTSDQYYIPQNPCVSVHNTVSATGGPANTATVNIAFGSHALTTGDTVIMNSTVFGLVNASVVVTVTSPSAFTFPYISGAISLQSDSVGGYCYLTQAKRDTASLSSTGTTVTFTSNAHGYQVNNTVFIHSPLLSFVGQAFTVQSVTTNTFTINAVTAVYAGGTLDAGGYSNRSILPFLLSAERTSNIVSLTFTSAPTQTDSSVYPIAINFTVGSYLRIFHSGLGYAGTTPFNVQSLASTVLDPAPNTTAPNNIIKFKGTGADYAPARVGNAFVNQSKKYHVKAFGKGMFYNQHGWFIAGAEPVNTATDKYMYDRLRVGYYVNMNTSSGYAFNAWNHYTLPNQPCRNFFGRHTYFGNYASGITQVTATDINVISEGAFMVGDTTAPATTAKGIIKFDSTTNQLSFSDGLKYFKVNEERIKFLFEGNIGNIALTKLNSVGEVNTLMSSAVYINKATEISEIYFIIGSVAAGQTSGQITVTLQHAALGQTLEIDAATVGTTVATATYNFINGVTISRYVKNTLSSITGSIPADRMLFAKIQTTSPFNGGANSVQDIVVTVKLR